MLKIHFDSNFVGHDIAKRLPFIISNTLNKLAYDSSQAVKRSIPQRFKLKRDWILKGLRYTKSTSNHPIAEVRHKDFFLTKQEEGGIYNPIKSSRLAIPTQDLQQTDIKKYQKPSRILERANFYKTAEGIFERKKNKSKKKWYRFAKKTTYTRRFEMLDKIEEYVDRHAKKEFEERLNKNVFVN